MWAVSLLSLIGTAIAVFLKSAAGTMPAMLALVVSSAAATAVYAHWVYVLEVESGEGES